MPTVFFLLFAKNFCGEVNIELETQKKKKYIRKASKKSFTVIFSNKIDDTSYIYKEISTIYVCLQSIEFEIIYELK